MEYNFTEEQVRLVYGILSEVMKDRRFFGRLGSITQLETQALYLGMKYYDFMKRHGIKSLDDMTPEDYGEYEEEYERALYDDYEG